MRKSVMISIQPKWVEIIASGEKTIEVRKSAPKLETPFKCYIYCTNDRKVMLQMSNYDKRLYLNVNIYFPYKMSCSMNGKVVGEFVCDEVLTIDCDSVAPFCKEWDRYVDKETCLTAKELFAYSSHICYGWHISNLKIYDKPQELSEFRKYFASSTRKNGKYELAQIARPPQSWCYVEEWKQ